MPELTSKKIEAGVYRAICGPYEVDIVNIGPDKWKYRDVGYGVPDKGICYSKKMAQRDFRDWVDGSRKTTPSGEPKSKPRKRLKPEALGEDPVKQMTEREAIDLAKKRDAWCDVIDTRKSEEGAKEAAKRALKHVSEVWVVRQEDGQLIIMSPEKYPVPLG